MTDKELIKEFKRWVKAGKPNVYVKQNIEYSWWTILDPTLSWSTYEAYIINDEQAGLRKLHFDNPETKFQVKPKNGKTWVDVESEEDLWQPILEYRIKPEEWYEDESLIGKPVWTRDFIDEDWELDVFVSYCKDSKSAFMCERGSWKFAKPVEPNECYKKEKDDK